MKRAGVLALAMVAGSATADEPPTAASLGWPADTASLEVTSTRHVMASPDRRALPIGKVVGGTRVGWTALAAGDRVCPVWVAIVPRGFVCARDVRPTSLPPAGETFPIVAPGAFLPGAYYDVVIDGTPAYARADDIAAGEPRSLLSTKVMVRSRGEVEIDGFDYQRTNKGLVPSSELVPLEPSMWVGLDLRAQPAPWPMAFVQPDHPALVRARPERDALVVAQLAPRAVVWVRSAVPEWIEIGADRWVHAGELRQVTVAPPPPGVVGDAPWIDIDLDEQTLVAYRGAVPVYVTLVSTGRRRGTTPVGLYRIVAMAATTGMAAEADLAAQYDVGEVPWALRWKKGLYLHAAYWHDRFGNQKSHGCVNLSPRDARAIYEWVTPAPPPGWSELEIDPADGVVVRIRDRANPDPPPYDYARERPKRRRR
jgi:hypothetical protein